MNFALGTEIVRFFGSKQKSHKFEEKKRKLSAVPDLKTLLKT